MRCTSPRTVGFLSDGKTISWSSKNFSKEFATFQLPCSKCIQCRLDYARQWAVRCVHESKMHENNIFLTLTYSDENLGENKLNYTDFQLFIKRLRDEIFRDFLKEFGKENWRLLSKEERKKHYDNISIGYFATGEYGEKSKRKHWHAIIFNYRPTDAAYKYSTQRGDKVFSSDRLSRLWPHGLCDFGAVTFESAGYVARYAAKKLGHGSDCEHEFQPISKKSSKHAIGRTWLERYYKDVFTLGRIVLENGETCSIPRYYEKWLKNHKPDEFRAYITRKKTELMTKAQQRTEQEKKLELQTNLDRLSVKGHQATAVITKNEHRKKIIESKFKQLQKNLKL